MDLNNPLRDIDETHFCAQTNLFRSYQSDFAHDMMTVHCSASVDLKGATYTCECTKAMTRGCQKRVLYGHDCWLEMTQVYGKAKR